MQWHGPLPVDKDLACRLSLSLAPIVDTLHHSTRRCLSATSQTETRPMDDLWKSSPSMPALLATWPTRGGPPGFLCLVVARLLLTSKTDQFIAFLLGKLCDATGFITGFHFFPPGLGHSILHSRQRLLVHVSRDVR